MSNGGEAADQMVREGIEITEAAVKLSALGAKNLAAIALALAKDNPKVKGKTNINHLLKEGKELQVFPLKATDLHEFKSQAKQYGVLFAAIKDKEGELVEVLCKAEDVSKLNRIFEKMGYPAPKEKVVDRKKAQTRRQPESASRTRGILVPDTNQTFTTDEKLSVRGALDQYREKLDREKAKRREEIERTVESFKRNMNDKSL